MSRNQGNSSWIAKALVYLAATTVAGAATGALLGLAGSQLSADLRTGLATVLALAGVAIGGAELAGRRLRVLQLDKETPQRWIHAGALRWALLNGGVLGFGATSRLGFWLWYVVPLGSFLSGSPALAAASYGLYGFVRGAGAAAMILGTRNLDTLALRLLSWAGYMRRVTSVQLAAFSLVAFVSAGTHGL